MTRIVLSIAILCGIAAPLTLAHADAVALVDAGASPDAAAPAVAVVPTFVIDAGNPLSSATSAWDLIKQAGWLWGGMAVLFGLGTYVIKKNETAHWLSNDHILAVGTTVIGVLGAIVNAHFGSGSWAAVIAVLVAGVGLIIQKPAPAGQKAP